MHNGQPFLAHGPGQWLQAFPCCRVVNRKKRCRVHLLCKSCKNDTQTHELETVDEWREVLLGGTEV